MLDMNSENGNTESNYSNSEFEEALQAKLSDSEMEKRNETLRKAHATEIMTAFAEHLNKQGEDAISAMISRIWGYSNAKPINFSAEEYFFPKRKSPFVGVSAEINVDIYNTSRKYAAPIFKAGTRADLFWLETDQDNPEQLLFAWRNARSVHPKGYDRDIFKESVIDYYIIHHNGLDEIFDEILEILIGWDIDPERWVINQF